MSVTLTTEEIRQGSAQFLLRLPFSLNGYTATYLGQTWAAKIICPDGRVLTKTTGIVFETDAPEISIPIDDYDLVQAGKYYYQVTLKTGGANVNSSVEFFTVEGSLPEGLAYDIISSAMNYFPIFTSGGALTQSNLSIDGNTDLYYSAGGAKFVGAVKIPADPYAAGWATKLEAATKKDVYDKIQAALSVAYNDESAQDAIGTILSDSATIDFTYNDAAPSITATVIQSGLTLANLSGNLPESRITNLVTDLAAKEPSIAAGLTTQYWRGDKSWQTLDKTAVGLSNVPNVDTTNATNISSGTLAATRLPAFSGDVTTPSGSSTTTIANSAVTLAKMANVASGTVFYRKTSGVGVPEVQTLATLKADLGLTGASIGGTVTGGTSGSILYVDSSGFLAQDNTHLFYDASAKAIKLVDKTYSSWLDNYSLTIGKSTDQTITGGYGTVLLDASLLPTTNNNFIVQQYQNLQVGGTSITGSNIIGLMLNVSNRSAGGATLGHSAQLTGYYAFVNGESPADEMHGIWAYGSTGSAAAAGTLWTSGGTFFSGYHNMDGGKTTGVYSEVRINSGGTDAPTSSSLAIAFQGRIRFLGATTGATEIRGLSLDVWDTVGGTSTITTSYGIYADASIDKGTTAKYFIYSLSTSPSVLAGSLAVPDDAYNATTWDGNFTVPTKNAIRDKIESLSMGGMSIGGTITSATQGSVLFAGASGVLAQNNNDFYWDDANKKLALQSEWARIDYLGDKRVNILIQPDDSQYGFTYDAGANDWSMIFMEADQANNANGKITRLIEGYVTINGTGTGQIIRAIDGTAISLASGAGTVAEVTGMNYLAATQSSRGATLVQGVNVLAGTRGSSGTVGTAYSVNAAIQAVNGSTITFGSLFRGVATGGAGGIITQIRGLDLSGWLTTLNVTTSYGIYMDASIDRGSTTKYAIYSLSTSPSLLTGSLTASSFIKSGGTSGQFLKADGSVDSSTYLTANQTITLSGDVSGSGTTAITTAIGANKVTLGMMATLAANSIIGNNTGSPATPIALTASQVKTLLSLNNVENTALSTWAGSTNITTLGTISTGTWSATSILATRGGTGISTYTLGDTLYSDASNSLAKLAGNTTSTKKFLTQTGTGSVSAAPAWGTIASGDLGTGTANTTTFLRGDLTWTAPTFVETDTLATVTGRGNTSSTGLDLTENGNTSTSYALRLTRNTDTASVGFFIQARNAAANSNLYTLDTAGNVTAVSFVKSGGTSSQFLKADGSVDSSTYLTANQTITLSGDVSGSGTTAITTAIGANKVTLGMMATLAANSIIGNNTGSTATPIALSTSQVKTLLALNNVENTALSTWAGSTSITTLGTISTGTWSATSILATKGGTGISTYTLGDTLYSDASNSLAKLAGNTTSTKKFLTQTGTGSVSAAPAWGTIATGDLGTGTANSTTFLRGDGTWAAPTTVETDTLATVTGRGNTSSTGLDLTENGNTSTSYALRLTRNTDTASVGFFIQARNAAANSNLYTLDTAGNVTAVSFVKSGGTSAQFLKADGSVDSSTYLTANQTITLSGDVSGSGTTAITTTIGANKVTLAMMATVATGTVFYRKTAATGNPEVQTLATLKTDLGLTGTNSGDQTITLTGDVTGSGTGSFATTLATVNSNVGTFNGITVNAKGLVTAAANITSATYTEGGNTSTSFALKLIRNTDTSPVGFLIYGRNAADNATLFSVDASGNVTGNSFVKSGGTSGQFLKADGSVDSSTYLTANQTITLSGDVSGSGTTAITTAIGSNKVTLGMMATLAANSIIGNNTGSAVTPVALTASQVKTLLSLNNVENTALSTWAGSTNITTLGTIGTGTWSATSILATKGGTGISTYTLGDTLYSDASNSLAKLAGNTTSTKKFLTQTGTGTVSAAPAWGTIASGDLGSGTANSTTYLRGDLTWQTISTTLAIGNAISGGGTNRVLYEDGSSTLAASANFTYDGTIHKLFGTTEQLRVGYDSTHYLSTSVASNGDTTISSNGTELIIAQTGDSLGTTKLHLQNRSGANGAVFENASLDLVDFGFKPVTSAQMNFRYEARSGSTVSALNSREFEFYDSAVPGFFFASGSSATVVNSGVFGVGVTSPSAKAHIIATTEQLRVGYDASNYFKTTVGSTGGVTFDAVGSGAGFTFSDLVTIAGGISGLTKSDVGLSNVVNVDQTNASNLSSGTVGTARLGSGTANSTTFLRGDQTWQTISSSVAWGAITGTLSAQTDLNTALNAKVAKQQTLYLSDYVSIAAAITAVGSTATDLVIDTPMTTAASATFPQTCRLIFTGNGKLTVGAGHTLTIGLMQDPGNKQVIVLTDATSLLRFSNGGVIHMNIAWVVGPNGGTCTNALNQFLATANANSGGAIYFPTGIWTTSGNHSLYTSLMIKGDGIGTPGATSLIRLTSTSTSLFTLGSSVYNVLFSDIGLDGNSLSTTIGVNCAGTVTSSGLIFKRTYFRNFTDGLKIKGSVDNSWQMAQVHIDDACVFEGCTHSAVYYGAVNGDMYFGADVFVPVSGYGFYIENSGPITINGAEFAGSGTYGTPQTIKQTIASTGGSGITVAGTATVTITAAGMTGSPRAVSVPLTTAENTSAKIAEKIRIALRDDLYVKTFFHVVKSTGSSDADVAIIAIDNAANDATMNMAIAHGTTTGLTDNATATTVASGAADSLSAACFYVTGAHGEITLINYQDESFKDSVINNAGDLASLWNMIGSTMQTPFRMNQATRVNAIGCSFTSKTFRDTAGGQLTSIGNTINPFVYVHVGASVTPYTVYSDISNFSTTIGFSTKALDVDVENFRIDAQAPIRAYRTSTFFSTTTPQIQSLSYDDANPVLRLGRCNDGGIADFYYDFYRSNSGGTAGRLIIAGNQAGFTGVDINCPVYSTAVVSSGGVSGTTGTFTGAVSGTTGSFSSALTATSGAFSAWITATNATFLNTAADQLRFGYNSSNYINFNTASNGDTTITLAGTTPTLRVSSPFRINSGSGDNWFPFTDNKNYYAAVEHVFRDNNNTLIFGVTMSAITIVDAVNFAFGTTTGTKHGTSTSQKQSFWNATPIVQPTTGVAAATFVAGSGTAVNDASTFDGYTLKQVVKALRNIGLLA